MQNNLTPEQVAKLASIYHVLAHSDRIHLLRILFLGPKAYSELMFESRTNPRMLTWHLKMLKKSPIPFIEKEQGKKGRYYLTGFGKVYNEKIYPYDLALVEYLMKHRKSD